MFSKVIVTLSCLPILSLFPETLRDLVGLSLQSHPSLSILPHNKNAQEYSTKAIFPLENPEVEWMKDSMGQYITLRQKINFPLKYLSQKKVEEKKVDFMNQQIVKQRWLLREEVIKSYTLLILKQDSINTTKAQKELLGETARVIEQRRVTGESNMQDEMKIHLEQSKIEEDLLNQINDYETLFLKLQELIPSLKGEVKIVKEELPHLIVQDIEKEFDTMVNDSPLLKEEILQKDQAHLEKIVAKSNYWPDFMLSYRESLMGKKEREVAIGLTIPLYFFSKEKNMLESSVQKEMAFQYQVETTKRNLIREGKTLAKKIVLKQKILQLYKNTLLPQSYSSLVTSKTAYKSQKIDLLELIDIEKNLYTLQQNYYQEQADYIITIAQLETMLGRSLSTMTTEGVL